MSAYDGDGYAFTHNGQTYAKPPKPPKVYQLAACYACARYVPRPGELTCEWCAWYIATGRTPR